MDFNSLFDNHNILSICDFLLDYCKNCLVEQADLTHHQATPFYNFFPTLLSRIFGSPTTRGWMHSGITPPQTKAILSLLNVDGYFFQAMLRMSEYPEYEFYLINLNLPADVQNILKEGCIQYLPRVYSQCAISRGPSDIGVLDVRKAATERSYITPMKQESNSQIRFSMIQFYFHYVLSVPTWPITPSYTQSNTSAFIGPTVIPNPSQTRDNSILNIIIHKYIQIFITCSSSPSKRRYPLIDMFFLDCCVELWLRNSWINPGGRLAPELMEIIKMLIKHIVKQDLRFCTYNFGREDDSSGFTYRMVYDTVRPEITFLISRLISTWRIDPDFNEVINLWLLWVKPWKYKQLQTNTPVSNHLKVSPVDDGWAAFIVENGACYISIVESILKITATFRYIETPIIYPTPVNNTSTATHLKSAPTTANTSHSIFGNTFSSAITKASWLLGTPSPRPRNNPEYRWQLDIFQSVLSLFSETGLVPFLRSVEKAVNMVQLEIIERSATNGPELKEAISVVARKCVHDSENSYVQTHKAIFQLCGVIRSMDSASYKPKNIYALSTVRNPSLTQSSKSLNDAITTQNSAANTTPGKNNDYLHKLVSTANTFQQIFMLPESENMIRTSALKQNSKENIMSPNITTAKKRVIAPLSKAKVYYENGPLCPEDLEKVKKGLALCTPSLTRQKGILCKEMARSYESMWVLSWIMPLEQKINTMYQKWGLSGKYHLPKRLSLRFFAAYVNLAWMFGLPVVLYVFYYYIYMYIFI
ncbi:hypothetical protein F4703DRAFT_1884641 [Phycomyces blakesleeanus]